MFIRATQTGTKRDGSKTITHRLVENDRKGNKVKQKTLLNLGRHFDIEKQYWTLLCQRIQEVLKGDPLIQLEPIEPRLEAKAREIVYQLIQRGYKGNTTERAKVVTTETDKDATTETEQPKRDWQTVDINSIRDYDGRSIGVEHAALLVLEKLGLPALLEQLGFSNKLRCCALGSIIGRMAQPGSERATAKWLRTTSATGELLDFDFAKASEMSLHRASDLLVKHQTKIEDHIFGQAKTLFDLKTTITLYDLTNTFFEGRATNQPKARRGRSKDKRFDAALLTLALVVDESGFVKRSKVHAGHVFEAHTLKDILASLNATPDHCVVMDAGIATEENLAWLRANKYKYIVVSRERKRTVASSDTPSTVTVMTTDHTEVTLTRHEVDLVDEDCHNNQTPYKEVQLVCHSEAKEGKEQSILTFFQERLEDGLTTLAANLSLPNKHKRLDYIHRKIGKLLQANAQVAAYYNITVTPDAKKVKAEAITWTSRDLDGSRMSHPGVYKLRSNDLSLESAAMWRTYTTLTDVESVFRSLKSELGLRPIYHRREDRSEGHLLISVLAYQAVQLLRTTLKDNRYTASWQSLRQALCSLQRTTTKFNSKSGGVLHVRKTADPNPVQEEIYRKMGLSSPPRQICKSVVM